MTYGPSSLSPWICNASKENEKLLAFRIALVFVGRWDTVAVAVAAVEKKIMHTVKTTKPYSHTASK